MHGTIGIGGIICIIGIICMHGIIGDFHMAQLQTFIAFFRKLKGLPLRISPISSKIQRGAP
jgi:hypothetical protein